MAFLGRLERRLRAHADSFVTAALFVGFLLLYQPRMCPSVVMGDPGEYLIAGYDLGIPHSLGFPLFTWLMFVFTHIPLADPALMGNAMGVLFGTMAAALVYALAL